MKNEKAKDIKSTAEVATSSGFSFPFLDKLPEQP